MLLLPMLNKNDALILSHLRLNARKNITTIAKETNIPVSTIFDKIKRFETMFFLHYTVLLDYKKLGYERATILVKVDHHDKQRFIDYVKRHELVNTVYKVNSRYDFLLEVVFRKLDDFYKFLEELKEFNIVMKEEYYIMDDIKREGFLSSVSSLVVEQ